MTKRLTIAIIAIASMLAVAAKDREEPFTAREAFTSMPEEVARFFDDTTVRDMLAYFDAGISGKTTNDIGSQIDIVRLEPEILVYTQGENLTTEIFVLNPKSEYPIIGVIETINTPVPDSNVKFYTHNWRAADNIVAIDPEVTQWLTKDGRKHIDDLRREVPFVLASYTYDPVTGTLILTNETEKYYYRKERPESLKYFKPTLKYKWTGTKFKAK